MPWYVTITWLSQTFWCGLHASDIDTGKSIVVKRNMRPYLGHYIPSFYPLSCHETSNRIFLVVKFKASHPILSSSRGWEYVDSCIHNPNEPKWSVNGKCAPPIGKAIFPGNCSTISMLIRFKIKFYFLPMRSVLSHGLVAEAGGPDSIPGRVRNFNSYLESGM